MAGYDGWVIALILLIILYSLAFLLVSWLIVKRRNLQPLKVSWF